MTNMYALAAEQATNFGDVAIALGGSILVAAASVFTIIISNKNNRTLKADDYRREELDRLAEALAATRKALGHLSATIGHIGSFHSRLAKGEQVSPKLIENHVLDLNDEIREAEATLIRIAYTNPHRSIRESARANIKAMGEASSVGLHELLAESGANPKYSEAVYFSDRASTKCGELQTLITSTYFQDSKNDKELLNDRPA